MNKLGQIVDKMLCSPKMRSHFRRALIIESWEQIVGREIAVVTRAREISEERLWVTVKDSTWAYHLSLLKPQLIKKANSFSGSKVIKDIYFRVGELKEKETVPEKANNTLESNSVTVQGNQHGETGAAYICEIKRRLNEIIN